jgi:hypothetical protein
MSASNDRILWPGFSPKASKIITYVHRPKRPPRKRKSVALAGPAIVRKAKPGNDTRPPEASVFPPLGEKPTIVMAQSQGRQNADVPDMTPEEFQRRVDAADALWLELVRGATSKDRP